MVFRLAIVWIVIASGSFGVGQATMSGGVTLSGGVTVQGGNSSGGDTWSDQMRKVTLAVGEIAKDEVNVDHFQTGGVAVIISDKGNHFFVATAKHVFESPEKNWFPETLRFRGWRDEKTSRYRDFGSEIRLRQNGKPLYIASTNFDLAIIPATQDLLHRISLNPREVITLQEQDFADEALTYDGESLIVLGFPALIGEEYQQHALMRAGVVAWTDPAGSADHEFLIDARIFPGNSGGPVFMTPTGVNRNGSFSTGGPVKLLGLVSKTINAKPDVAFGVALPTNAMVIGAAGVGVIEPAKELLVLMKRAEELSN